MTNTDRQHSSASVSLGLVVVLFLVVHVGLSWAGLVPSEVSEFNQHIVQSVKNLDTLSYEQNARAILPRKKVREEEKDTVIGALPTTVRIPKISVDKEVSTPEDTSVEVLDEALKDGVVHYPSSGGIGGDRRMFLFGHSSRLPVVNNQAYRAFNGLDKLAAGDPIYINASSSEVTYRVRSVEVVDESEAWVSLESGTGELTLSTCTTFGSRQNRVVVRATAEEEASR